MHKGFLTAGAIFGALAVALGAFGAHGLENLTSDQKILDTFRTGVQYQIYHALAIVAVAFFYDKLIARRVRLSGYCFIGGHYSFFRIIILIGDVEDPFQRCREYYWAYHPTWRFIVDSWLDIPGCCSQSQVD